MKAKKNKPIVFFDGPCNLCNSLVRFVVRFDRNETFLFATLEDRKSQAFLIANKLLETPDSIILFENNLFYFKSDAALQIARHLYFWKILYFLKYIPVKWRDLIYDSIARYRYKVFGKKEVCRIDEVLTQDRIAKF